MRARHANRLIVLSAAVLLTGCVDLVGLFDGRPDSYVERDGLSYQVIVSESQYAYDTFEYRLRITNTSRRTIERGLPEDMVTPRVYRDGQWSRPVWSPCRSYCGGWGRDVRIWLRPGEAIEGWWGEVDAQAFASHSRYGVYHLTLMVDTGRDRFEVLGLPEIRVR